MSSLAYLKSKKLKNPLKDSDVVLLLERNFESLEQVQAVGSAKELHKRLHCEVQKAHKIWAAVLTVLSRLEEDDDNEAPQLDGEVFGEYHDVL